MSGTWVALFECCCLCPAQWPAGLPGELCLRTWVLFPVYPQEWRHILEWKGSGQTVRPQTLHLVLLQASVSSFVNENNAWPVQQSNTVTAWLSRMLLCKHKRLLCSSSEKLCCCWFKIKEVNWLIQGHIVSGRADPGIWVFCLDSWVFVWVGC